MNRVTKILSIAAATAAMTGVAFADDPTPDAGGGATAGATVGGSASVGTDGAKVDASASATVGVFTAATWPKDYVMRPQNAAKGMIEITPAFSLARSKDVDAMGNESTSNVTSLGVGGRFGLTDKIEALASFNRIVLTGVDGIKAGDRFKGSLAAGVGINLAVGKIDAEVKAAIAYDLLLKNALILAGVDVRFHLAPKMWIGTPVNRPGLVIGVKGAELGGMDIPGTKPIEFILPLAFAFQATPELAFQANTRLFQLNLNEDAKGGPDGKAATFFGSDEFGGIPFDVDVIYAVSNTMDVLVNLNLVDLKHVGDNLGISAGVNIRM